MRAQFLAGAQSVIDAVDDDAIVAAWESPSVLADQAVGGLVGHLCRGTIWVVLDYLDQQAPEGAPDFEIAAAYFSRVADGLDEAAHAAIRARGAEAAAKGHAAVVDRAREAFERLRSRLPDEPPNRMVSVYAGLTMRLDDYLFTRIVEQVVHLDDLARSIDVDPWPNPPDAEALVVACGAEIGRLRHGGPAMIRTLFRDGGTGTLPVL